MLKILHELDSVTHPFGALCSKAASWQHGSCTSSISHSLQSHNTDTC